MISKFRSISLLGLCALLVSVFYTNKSCAQLTPGYAAGDLYIDYVGTGPTDYTYRINLVVYTLCVNGSSASLPATTETVNVTNSCDNKFCIKKSLPKVGNTDTVSQLCAAYAATLSSCANASSSYPGFQVTVYSDTVNFAQASNYLCATGKYDFYWLTTIKRAPSTDLESSPPSNIQTLALEAEINNSTRANVSTPRYTTPAEPQYLCSNMHTHYTNSPYSPNGDSMVTANIQLYANANGACASTFNLNTYYNSGYGANNPVNAPIYDQYKVNPVTGDVTFTSVSSGSATNYYTAGFRTYAYDAYTSEYLGYAGRDVQITVVKCDTATYPLPTIDTTPEMLSGGTLSGYDTITVCPKTQVSFIMSGYNTKSSLYKIYMNSNNAVAAKGSTFTTFGGGGDTVAGTFTWTPTGTDVGFHTVVFTAEDSSCSGSENMVLESRTTLIIHVLSSIYAGKIGNYCGAASDSAIVYAVGPPGTTYTWSDATTPSSVPPQYMNDPSLDSPKVAPPNAYCYSVTINTNIYDVACATTDTICVGSYTAVTLSNLVASPSTICANQSSVLSYTVSPAGFVAFQKWSAVEPGSARTINNDSSLTPKVSPLSTTHYVLYLGDKDTCTYHDTVVVNVNGVAPLVHAYAIPRDTVCPGGSVQFGVNAATQACGLATGGATCAGTITNIDQGKKIITSSQSSFPNYTPTPFNYSLSYYTSGGRMEILYSAKDLIDAGIQPGYLNSIAFNVVQKNTSNKDTFYNFTIKIACTRDNQLKMGQFTNYPWSVVYGPLNKLTTKGWNTFNFPTPYYWDGASNIAVDVCYGWRYDNSASADQVSLVTTNYTASYWNYEIGSCCDFNGNAVYNGCGTSTSFSEPFSASSYRPETKFNACSPTSFTYTWTETPTPPNNLDNPNIANPVASNIQNSATYKVVVASSTDPGCTGSDSVNIYEDTSVSITAAPHEFVLCRPGYVSLTANGKGPRPLLNTSCGPDNPVKCVNQDTTYSFGNPYSPGASNSGFYFGPPFEYPDFRTQIIITSQDLLAAGMKPGTINQLDLYIDPATNQTPPVAKNLTLSLGCTTKQGFKNSSDFVNGLTAVYSNMGVNYAFIAGTNNFPFNLTTYNWDTTQGLVVQICYDASTSSDNFASVMMTTTSYTSMIANYNFGGSSICSGGGNSYGTFTNRPTISFEECENKQDSVFHYTWYPGDYLSDSTIQAPTGYVSKSVKYYVSTHGRNLCTVKDSVDIFVPTHNFSTYPIDTAVCLGISVQLNATGGNTYQWYQNGYQPATSLSCDNCNNPVATPTDTTTYQIVVTDNVNCSDTITNRIDIKPIPNVKVVAPDTTIEIESSIQLYATGAFIYNWWPASSLNNPNIVNPVASPKVPTTYVVTGTGLDGCVSSDSVTINLGYRAKVSVPTGFTPNGDGKNDVFHVTNMTSEKVVEFHVYNRWGQEVFSATDNKGWDGTWNGVPQDIGVYSYIVRVSYLDGKVQTFKGEVTLIR